jgi:hypothetical protein
MAEETRARILVVEDDPEAALFLVHVETATALIDRGRPLSDDLRRGNLRAWL